MHGRKERGVTLIELMVGMAIALFLTAAAVMFVNHQTRLMGASSDRLEVIQGGRVALDLITEDLRKAGQGISYDEGGNFRGLLLGQFAAGGIRWNPDGGPALAEPVPTPRPAGADGFFRNSTLALIRNGAQTGTWISPSVDIGVQFTDGAVATIANFDGITAGTLSVCALDIDNDYTTDTVGRHIQDGRHAILKGTDMIAARTVELSGFTLGGCPAEHACVFGCYNGLWNDIPAPPPLDPTYFSGPAAFGTGPFAATFVGGDFTTDYHKVVWFVTSQHAASAEEVAGVGVLQRADFDGSVQCSEPVDSSCGGTVARNVESLQMVVWQWDRQFQVWRNMGDGQVPASTDFLQEPAIPTPPGQAPDRLRVDLELVMKSEAPGHRTQPQIALRLRPGACAPGGIGGCNADFSGLDTTLRRIYRTSVEIKNSGYGTIDY